MLLQFIMNFDIIFIFIFYERFKVGGQFFVYFFPFLKHDLSVRTYMYFSQFSTNMVFNSFFSLSVATFLKAF